ncbi:TrkH family potassium uptake protein [Halocatena salina]|uniref:TrkH family potassium uptake protein n=1 Tax=Halocatena salina TaxID=2934340 RepID=A0A8U0A243_9EURY|nr:TrkH family potassium uptake protein [Halocatena salina]UPM42849.1 TrkH family potassium uptake protein [Halocatena salina]
MNRDWIGSWDRLRVDWRASVGLVGTVVKYLAGAFLIPLAVALYYGEDVLTFIASLVFAIVVGVALERADPDPELGAREGFLMVALTWLVVAFVGMMPYLIAGIVGTESTLARPENALFESMSGFTTTGATVMGDISFDRHSHALLLWRQLTQWLGGMGIIVLAVAILPELSVGGAQLMDAEAPGPGIQKLTPRIAKTARVLWIAYLGFTLLEMVLLYGLHLLGLAPNMGLYNAVSHALTTLPTGGFSPEARSIEAFSAAVQWVIIPFMVVAGTNFALFWHCVTDGPKRLLNDTEFQAFTGIIAALTAIVAGQLFFGIGLQAIPVDGFSFSGKLEASVRHAAFQIVSIVTTTGYASMDFNTWSAPAKYVLLFGMFIGGSAGSTAGAIKVVRWVVVLKSLRKELFTTVHPAAVAPVRLNGNPLDERTIRGIYAFTLLYLVFFFVGVVLVIADAWRVGHYLSAFEAMSAVAATLGNVGPGFGSVGPMNSYLDFPLTSKLFMVFLMWIGRLEILPVLVLLTPAYWRT